MGEVDVKTEGGKQTEPEKTPEASPDLKTAFDDLKAAGEKAADENKELAKQVHTLTGQLSVLSSAAQADQGTPEPPKEAPDFAVDPEAALEHHYQQRTQPLIAQQLQRESKREEEVIALKHPDDWKEYNGRIKELIQQNRITVETLAQPGTYENLLKFVKAQDVDNIVTKRVEAEVAKVQEDAAKAATGGMPVAAASVDKPTAPSFSDDQKHVFSKLGVSEKDAAEDTKNVTFDGHRLTGPLVQVH